jgi:hypothetical protein
MIRFLSLIAATVVFAAIASPFVMTAAQIVA